MANGRRGRPRKSPEDHKLAGTYREDRHGANEINPTGRPVKPDRLEGHAAELWDYLTPRLVELEIATDLDQHALEALCTWYAEFCEARDELATDSSELRDLADAIRELADEISFADASLAGVGRAAMGAITAAIEGRSQQRRRRAQRMKDSWREFVNLASRFAMTPSDRRSMKDIPGTETKNDPIARFLEEQMQLGAKLKGEG